MANVLLLEDNNNLNKVLCLALEAAGHRVRCETDGTKALENPGESPDIIVLDVMMPKLDGPTVLTGLIEHGFEGKVIVISGRDDSRRLSQWMGADAFLKKPFGPEDLVSAVEALVGRPARSGR